MEPIHGFLVFVWIAFLGLFLTLYVLLDGFDLGIGILSLFVRVEERRGIMMASLSGVWDANETWLVVLGGALFGAFPLAYAVILHGLYLPIVTMIFALAFRGVAFEFREHARHHRRWMRAFGIGSLVAAICQGLALGGLIGGLAVRNGEFAGGAFAWLSPFSIVAAAGVVFGYVLLGSTFLIIKTEGEYQEHHRRHAWVAGALMLAVAFVISVWTPIRYPFVAREWFGGGFFHPLDLAPLVGAIAALMLARSLRNRYEYAPFWWTTVIFIASLSGLAAALYPYLVPPSLTAGEAAADTFTLTFMLLGIGMLTPIMIAYNAYQYLVFRGKVPTGGYGADED